MGKSYLDRQFGNKNSWRFRSLTTPGHSFSLIQFLAEVIILQRYGLKVPPYFWYKNSRCHKIRDEFKQVQNKIAGMIKRKNGITACELLGVVCEKFPPLSRRKVLETSETPLQKASEPLMELEGTTDTLSNNRARAKWAGEKNG